MSGGKRSSTPFPSPCLIRAAPPPNMAGDRQGVVRRRVATRKGRDAARQARARRVRRVRRRVALPGAARAHDQVRRRLHARVATALA
eukprot:4507042-Prymnesium_polylepis.1